MIEVKQSEGIWGVFVDNELLGTSKNRFDADYAAQILIKHIQYTLNRYKVSIGRDTE